MNTRQLVVALLIRLYPQAWRSEYGAELGDILRLHPLTMGGVLDVLRGALWQRVRTASPAAILGTGAMVLALTGILLSPTAYGRTGTAWIQPSGKTFPTITITFFASEFFAVLLVVCGCWTTLRRGGGAAKAAMWMTLFAGVPTTVAGVLMATGVVSPVFLMPGDVLRTATPSAWAMIIAPFVRAPESAIWGAVGGQLGRWLARRTGSSPTQRAPGDVPISAPPA